MSEYPGIAAAGLKGSVMYHDGQFDDARLALALARTAEDHGALVLNYVRCTELLKSGGKVTGAKVSDLETGSNFNVHAGAVINATGIFVDTLRQQDTPGLDKLLSVSRGTHLVIDGSFLSGSGAVAGNAIMVPKTDDGRIIFAIPWLGKVVVGHHGFARRQGRNGAWERVFRDRLSAGNDQPVPVPTGGAG